MAAYDGELSEILQRSRQAGVKTILTIGIDLPSSRAACHLAHEHSGVYAAVGIHPHHAEECDQQRLDELTKLASQPQVVAYGEIGIDCFKDYAPLARQQQAFRQQLELACSLKLPVIIHDRDAHDLILATLKEQGPLPAGGVIHCFSGDSHVAQQFLDLGFYLSIPGVVTFKKAEELQEAAAMIPLDRLLVETDGPFLAPEPWRGKRNEPAYTLYTAEKVAELKGLSLPEIAQATTANACQLFGLPTETSQ